MSDLPPLPPVKLGYTDNDLDRMSAKRGDDIWLTATFADPRARLYVFAGETPILRRNGDRGDPLFTAAEAAAFGEPIETAFLGLANGAPRYARLVKELVKPDPNAYRIAEITVDDPTLLITDMRTIAMQGVVEPHHLGPMAEGKALMHWHASHRHCGRCGGVTEAKQAGWRRDCPSCGAQNFPRTDPVVIMLPVDGDRCLMGRQRRFPPGMYSALAGFLEPGETVADAVRREIMEEAGIKVGRVGYLFDQPWPYPASLMIGCHAEALSRDIEIDTEELEDARWFTREECWQILTRQHPERLSCPPPLAIAHHLIRSFVNGGLRLSPDGL
ncbi:MAG: NAD(+) diphosphatase [Phreatobacter sp.]|uniref:NAD(+) diphosphatase n=1 Tax=Phreatobacter sp. TaxID=1966341 RepID=UPI001A50F20D|nr:NAD(+) diphosphatase [Phreatobacter sp.]MBL8570541.1 NAD(+) diphosphatase [Phreatobacter sp.]